MLPLGSLTLLFLFPLGAPRQGGAPWFIYTVTALFVAGVVASAIPGLDEIYSMSLLNASAILAYIRTWIRIGNEQPWLARIGWILAMNPFAALVVLSLQLIVPGEPPVLWPSKILLLSILGLALPDLGYSFLLISAAVAMQGMSGRLAIAVAVATGLGLSRFGHPAAGAAGLTAMALLLARRQLSKPNSPPTNAGLAR